MKLYPKFVLWWLGRHFVFSGALLVLYFITGALTDFKTFDMGFIAMIFNFVVALIPSMWAMTGRIFPLSMGVTRKQFFLMGQLLKLICLAIEILYMWQFTSYPLAAGIGLVFAAECSGELFGALSTRLGKKGIWIFCILCACAGGVAGATYSVGESLTILVMPLLTMPAMAVVGVLVGCCETAVSWLLCRKMEVR